MYVKENVKNKINVHKKNTKVRYHITNIFLIFFFLYVVRVSYFIHTHARHSVKHFNVYHPSRFVQAIALFAFLSSSSSSSSSCSVLKNVYDKVNVLIPSINGSSKNSGST